MDACVISVSGGCGGLLDLWTVCDLEEGPAGDFTTRQRVSQRPRRYRSLVFAGVVLALVAAATLSGCARRHVQADDDTDCIVDPTSLEPRPDPISTPILPELTFSASESAVDAIHQILGDEGDLPPTKPLPVRVGGGYTVTIPVGVSLHYKLEDGVYRFTLRDPKPDVSGGLFGLLAPRVAAVRLNPDNSAVASINHRAGTTEREFHVSWSGRESGAATESLPEVWAYSQSGCPPCATAKKALDAEADKLPFKVVWQSGERPACVTGSYPAFWYHVRDDKPRCDDSQNTRVKNGWPGLKPFIENWKANRAREPPAAAPVLGGSRYIRHTSDMMATVTPCNVPSVISHLRDTDTIHGRKFRLMSFAVWSLADLLDLHSDDHAGCVDWSGIR